MDIIWEVRQNIRHKTVHDSLVSRDKQIEQEESEIIYDFITIKNNYFINSDALLALDSKISQIARYMALDKLFNTKTFPTLGVAHCVSF